MYEIPQCISNDSFEAVPHSVSGQKSHTSSVSLAKLPRKKLTLKMKRKQRRETLKNLPPLEANRLLMWREHRQRMLNVVSELDRSPPTFQAVRLTGVNVLRENADTFMQRTRDNIQMLVGLTQTMRTHGVINPFRYEAPFVMSAVPGIIGNLERMERDNRDLGRRIRDVVSEVDSGLRPDAKGDDQVQTQPFTMPNQALAKYKAFHLNLPTTDKERWQLFRPRIYFDIYLKDTRPLGRFVVQLYTEAAPLVVLHLVRCCMCNMHNKFLIKRLFPGLWLDVELPIEHESPLHRRLEYDGKIIDHGAYDYVLSFSKDHLQGFRDNMFFSVSFKPLSVVNGSRVGFGHVVKGGKILECLQSYGTKNGTLSRGILFTSCGVL
ncbi:uncharacterized protein LOC116805898 [Drosophila grimshawi]|uniref:uncharacterized protein LOC116805898 n=1 Tax=Drosophila grimshawi TaxID=7222 RepID=UPI000C870A0F|nr:uncharacterized protein LOC116805898 [Drosophila grimshawi]